MSQSKPTPVPFKAIHALRLLALADFIEQTKAYDQTKCDFDCGTPACAMGHARVLFANEPAFRISAAKFFGVNAPWNTAPADSGAYFPSDKYDYHALFGAGGCGNAGRSKTKAVKFIRAFVAQKAASTEAA